MSDSSVSNPAEDEFSMYEDQVFDTTGGLSIWEADDYIMCPTCDGLGCDKWDDDDLCWRCMGEGMIPEQSLD